MKQRRQPVTLETIQNVALTCASERYAFSVWQSRDWAWYELLRQCLYDAVESGRITRFTAAQARFLTFTKDHLACHFANGTSERVMFDAWPRPQWVTALAAACGPRLDIDNCPVFL